MPTLGTRGLTTEELREVMPTVWPTRERLLTPDGEPTPFYGIRTPAGTYGAPPVSPTFHHFNAGEITQYVCDVASLAFGESARTRVRPTGGGVRLEFYAEGDVDPRRYGVHILGIFEPNVKPFTLQGMARRVVCWNGMSAPIATCGGKVRNSVHAFEGNVMRLADLVTTETHNVLEWSNWVETLGGVNLTDTEARAILGRILGLPEPNMGKPTPKQEATVAKYVAAYYNAPGAEPGTLRGILESVTYVASHGASTRERPGALVPHSETEKREDGTLPGGRLRQPYDRLIQEIEEMELGLVLN